MMHGRKKHQNFTYIPVYTASYLRRQGSSTMVFQTQGSTAEQS